MRPLTAPRAVPVGTRRTLLPDFDIRARSAV